MAEISDGQVDLFGNPLLPEKGRGRPAHVWTTENSQKVNLLFACGRKPIEIARVLKVSKPTFYKHYFNEIANAGHAPLMMRARQLQRLNKLAEDGNVSAEKALAGMIEAERRQVMAERMSDAPPLRQTASNKGKKEQAREDAENATGLYAPEAPPPGAALN